MKHNILVLGKGFIGAKIQQALHCAVSEKRIASYADAEKEIVAYRPTVIINCIGTTGSRNVDDCELDKDRTLSSNTFVPVILGEAALRRGIKLVHISSGCIYRYDYAHDKPITETKTPDFFELFYSRSKIYAERALETLSRRANVLIVRIRIPLDNRPHPRNILTKLINYKKVIDIPNSVTYLPDFEKALQHLLRIDARGIYNVVNKSGLRYPGLLEVYKRYVPGFSYKVIPYKKLNLVRTNLLMSTHKLEKTGFKVRKIGDVLEECVKEYINADRRRSNADSRRQN